MKVLNKYAEKKYLYRPIGNILLTDKILVAISEHSIIFWKKTYFDFQMS